MSQPIPVLTQQAYHQSWTPWSRQVHDEIIKTQDVVNEIQGECSSLGKGVNKVETALQTLKGSMEKHVKDLEAIDETVQSIAAYNNGIRSLNIGTKFEEIDEAFEIFGSAFTEQTKANEKFVAIMGKHAAQLDNLENAFTTHESVLKNHASHIQQHQIQIEHHKELYAIHEGSCKEKCDSNSKRIKRIEKFQDSAFPEIVKLQTQAHVLVEKVEKQLQEASNKTLETGGSVSALSDAVTQIEVLNQECVYNAAQIDQLKIDYGQLLDELRQLKKMHAVVSEKLSPRNDIQLSDNSENHLKESALTQSQKDAIMSMMCSNSYPSSVFDSQPGAQVSPSAVSGELASSKVCSLNRSEQSDGDLTKSQKTAM